MAYSLDQKAHARELFVEQGLTYDEVAAETGVSPAQLKKWGKEGAWVEGQKEFERDYMELTTNVHKLKIETVRKALTSKHSQDVIAATNILKAMPVGRARRSEVDKAALFIEWAEGLISYLKDRDGQALKYLQPHIQGYAEAARTQG